MKTRNNLRLVDDRAMVQVLNQGQSLGTLLLSLPDPLSEKDPRVAAGAVLQHHERPVAFGMVTATTDGKAADRETTPSTLSADGWSVSADIHPHSSACLAGRDG